MVAIPSYQYLDQMQVQLAHTAVTFTMILVLVLIGFLAGCHGYKAGAPLEVCGDMTPKHEVSAQTTDPPYNITVSASSYKSGVKVTVTVTSLEPTDRFFEGFFLQARKTGSTTPIGTFSVTAGEDIKTIKCTAGKYDNNAVTHKNETKRTSKTVMWTSEDGEDVFFQATFVNHKATFWTNVRSATLMGDGGVNSASGHAQNVLMLLGLTAIACIFKAL